MRTFGRIRWAVLLVLIALASTTLVRVRAQVFTRPSLPSERAAAPVAAAAPADESFENRAEEALAKRVTFRHEATLAELAAVLREKFDVGVRIDEEAVRGIGHDPAEKLLFEARDTSLDAALALALRDADLEVVVEDGQIVLTTMERASDALIGRLHPVGDLVLWRNADGDLLPARYGRSILSMHERLILSIHALIAPQSWRGSGPSEIVPFREALLVPQTRAVHGEVRSFLAALRTFVHHKGGEQPLRAISVPPGLDEIDAKLDRRATLVVKDVPLTVVARQLGEEYGIVVRVDERSIRDSGAEAAGAVTVKGTVEKRDVPLREILTAVAAASGTDWVIGNEAVIFRSPESAAVSGYARLYPVADLCEWSFLNEIPDVPLAERYEAEPAPERDYEALKQFMLQSSPAETWEPVGGEPAMLEFDPPGVLAVLAPRIAHERIDALLVKLRAAAKDEVIKGYAAEAARRERRMYVETFPLTGDGDKTADVAELVALVRAVVIPESWKDAGAAVSHARGHLVVRHRYEVQVGVYRLLKQLGALRQEAPKPQPKVDQGMEDPPK